MSAAPTKTKKSTATKKAAPSKAKGAAGKTSSHPPFADIIRQCIVHAGDRTGVSRPTIKKFVEDKYKLEVTPSVISNINRAIAYGAEKGTFVLPKGPSGKVKLAPKHRTSDSAKENARPVKAAAPPKKPATKSGVKSVKKPRTTGKVTSTAKKAAPKKKTTSIKKKTKPSVPAKKTASKRAPAKKSITGTTKAKTAGPKSKASAKAKTTSAAPASKRKTASPAKPSSKAASAKPVSGKK